MKCQVLLTVGLCALLSIGSALKLPKNFKRCRVAPELDGAPNECLKVAVNDAIHSLSMHGSREIGVGDLDPMRINNILIQQGASSPIAIRLEFFDNDFIGLSNYKVHSVRGKLSSPNEFMLELDGLTPQVQLVGKYTISGKVLVLPIQGEGMSNLTMDALKSKTIIVGEPEVRNGKEYLKINKLTIKIGTTRMYTDLGNLFNGDKALGDNMNKFLNDNWGDIYKELEPAIEGAFGAIFEQYSKRLMERIPFKDIFILN